MNTENSKPEWFQMTEAGAFPKVSKGKRTVRIMALTAPLLVLGAGFVYAQSQNSPGTTASAATSLSTAASTPITLAATATPATAAATASTPVTTQHASVLSSTPVAASNISFTSPIKKPTGGEGSGDDNSTLSLNPAPTLSPLSTGTPSIGGIKKPTGGSDDENGSDD